jgi:hypothetical protein
MDAIYPAGIQTGIFACPFSSPSLYGLSYPGSTLYINLASLMALIFTREKILAFSCVFHVPEDVTRW